MELIWSEYGIRVVNFPWESQTLSSLPLGVAELELSATWGHRFFWPATLGCKLALFVCFSLVSPLFSPKLWGKVLHMFFDGLDLKAFDCLIIRRWGPSDVDNPCTIWNQMASTSFNFASLSLDMTQYPLNGPSLWFLSFGLIIWWLKWVLALLWLHRPCMDYSSGICLFYVPTR